MRRSKARRSGQSGAIILGFLVLVALFGLGLASAAQWLRAAERQEKEQDLLFVGHQFRQAIDSYRRVTGQYPRRLEDLLLDVRSPTPRRHLRRIFTDPLTGKPAWGLVKAPDGGILGVFSLSTLEPMKRQGFDSEHKELEQYVLLKLAAAASSASATEPGGMTALSAMSSWNSPRTPAFLAGAQMASSLAQEGEFLPPDPQGYNYRDWKFWAAPQVIGTSGGSNSGGG